jgi:hypothetical protein
MHSITRRTGLLALLAVLVTGLVAAVAVAQRSEDEPIVGAPGTVLAPVSDSPTKVKQKLGVLRRAARPTDRPTKANVDPTYARSTGLNLNEARRLRGTKDVYVVPGQDVTCLLTGGQGATCTPDEAVGKDFQVQTCGQVPKGVVSVSGLVPDGVASAVIRRKDGSVLNVAVEANYIDASVSVAGAGDVPTAVEFKGSSAPLHVVAPDEMDCAAQ